MSTVHNSQKAPAHSQAQCQHAGAESAHPSLLVASVKKTLASFPSSTQYKAERKLPEALSGNTLNYEYHSSAVLNMFYKLVGMSMWNKLFLPL
jgi:hypothetical protein